MLSYTHTSISPQVSKKLLNSVDRCVDEALEGLVICTGKLQLVQGHRVVVRADLAHIKGKVALLSGGGSGHEPAHAGYVGSGMLTGAIAGAVFTSPPPASITAAIQVMVNAEAAGVLLIVKNYMGDLLNFGLALEEMRAKGVPVKMVVVADDCAFTTLKKAGRRGLCGTVLIHKIAGALSEMGKSLDEIVEALTSILPKMGTIGVSLSSCSIPGTRPTFHLEPDELEMGLGIHGEAGIARMKMMSADEVVHKMVDHMINPSNMSHLSLKAGDHIVLVVNNLGGLSCLEMNVVAKSAFSYLESQGVLIARAYVGSYMTSLDMAGVSLTLLHVNEELLNLLDRDTSASGWRHTGPCSRAHKCRVLQLPEELPSSTEKPAATTGPFAKQLKGILGEISTVLLSMEEELNQLDREGGDGDCGSTHARGARAIQVWLSSGPKAGDGSEVLTGLARVVQHSMGGTSGALYSLFLTAAAQQLVGDQTAVGWVAAMAAGIEVMQRYGGASPGDRTMLDPLCAACEELQKLTPETENPITVLEAAVQKAQAAVEATKDMTAQAGRASYILSTILTNPDPGAIAVTAILKTILYALQTQHAE
uniref:Triokinase/FMN cyclase n=1 Tax=Callorhinchus milii TaxID=7868 RepID=V9KJR4_CALMI